MKNKKPELDPKRMLDQELTRGRRLFKWVNHHHMIALAVLGVVVILVCCGYFVWKTQLPFAAKVAHGERDHRVDVPITIQLEQAVHPDFVATITPQAKGQWQTTRTVFGVQSIQFIPEQNGFSPDVDYVVTITNLNRITGQPLPDLGFTITTEQAPAITAIMPSADAQNVPIASDVTVTLERSNRNLRKLRATLEPVTEVTMLPPESDDSVYRWRPNAPLKQGQRYTLTLFDDHSLDPAKPVATTSFSTVAEPHILNATNRTHFYPGEVIDVLFDVAMRQDQPGIQCQCQGTGIWVSESQYQFTPSNIEVAKTYQYTVPVGLASVHGGARETVQTYEIRTPGAVVASIRGLGSNAVANAEVVITFDQAVDRASAESRFSISPNVAGSFRWSNNTTLVFAPSSYEAQTGYKVTLAPGVKPTRFGLDSTASFGMAFSTTAPVVRLNVPLYRQQHRASCEAAALRMALAYRGVHDTDFSIVQRMGYNGQPKNQAANTWDDPFEMYVGDINGLQSTFQGYGAYAPPIARAAQAYGRGASIHYGVSAQFIAEQIHAGNPVIIIGTVSGMAPRYTSWNGPNGLVHAWIGEHARTVIGVTGKASAPISFLVNDPNTGSQLKWSAGQLMADINAIPQLASQVVVIH